MNNQEWVELGKKYCMNTYGRLPIAMVEGKGCYVKDADGKEYLDFVAGIAVNSLGHCPEPVVAAIKKQCDEIIHCSNIYWIPKQVELAQLLCENSCYDKVFFCNSGAEANEGCIKLARKYAITQGHPEKYEIITMKKSFHGRTMGTMAATGQDKIHNGFGPVAPGFVYADYNDIDSLKKLINEKTCAIMLEPVQGEGGVINAEVEYLKQVRELCDQNGLVLIYDEVQVGIGRTGKLFAYQVSGVEADITSLAKALGNGAPIGAFMAKQKVADAFQPGDHGSTYGGNPLVTAAACAVVKTMLEKDIPAHAAKIGAYFKEKLAGLKAKYSYVDDVRGQGLLLGLGLKIPGGDIVAKCLEKGLLINCTAGTVLRFVPPLIITEAEVDKAVAILDEVMSTVKAE